MRLSAYLSTKKLRVTRAARELGLTPETFRLWVSGQRIPRPDYMVLIYRWSKGAVQPNDFYDLSDPGPLNGLPLFENGSHAVAAPPGEKITARITTGGT